ncbi:MAG: hypothetical protein SPJ04_04335 [Bdellovibrionota bacterium]|nr:hypothetical protein [Bdellovibrionota bacterium]
MAFYNINGNKRAFVIFENHFLIKNGESLLVIPENLVAKFKNKLILFFEDKDKNKIHDFLKEKYWRNF